MEVICPVCALRMKGQKYEVGSKATCAVCRIRFEARAIVDYHKLEARESKREFVVTQVLPLCTLILVLCCGAGANYIHLEPVSTAGEDLVDADQRALIRSASQARAALPDRTAAIDLQTTDQARPPWIDTSVARTQEPSPEPAESGLANAGTIRESIGERRKDSLDIRGYDEALASDISGSPNEISPAMGLGAVGQVSGGFAGSSAPEDVADVVTVGGSVIRLETVNTDYITVAAPDQDDEFRSAAWLTTMPEDQASIFFAPPLNAAVTWKNGSLHQVDLQSGASSEFLSTAESRVTCGIFARQKFAWGTASGERLYWSGSGQPKQIGPSHSDIVTAAAIDALGTNLTTCSLDGTVLRTSLRSSSSATRLTLPAPALSFCSAGRTMVVGCADRSLLLSESPKTEFVRGFRASSPARFLAIDDSRTYLAVSGGERLEVRDMRSFELCQLWEDLSSEVSALALSADGDLIAIGHLDGSLKIFSVADRKEIRTERLTTPATSLTFSGSHRLGVATTNGELILMELGEDIKSLPVESKHNRIVRYARKEHAAVYTEADMKIDTKLKQLARNTPSRIQRLLARVPQYPVGVNYFLKTGTRSGQVTAVGHGFENVTGVDILRGGERPMSVKFHVLSDAKLELRLPSSSADTPLIGLKFEGGYVVTVPMTIEAANKATLNSDREDEIVYLYSTYDTLDDTFQLLLMLERGCIKEDISGSGLVVATSSAVLPEALHGEIGLISTTSHKAPLRDSRGSSPNIVVEMICVCPIPPVFSD